MSSHFNPFLSIFSGLLSARSQPMTNAGRYLQQLETGENVYAMNHNDESPCGEELLAGLRRIQITSAKEAS